MKTLYILRHAKSSWEHSGIKDYERPLIKEGVQRTKKIVQYLLRENCSIDLIKSSHAIRARETAGIIQYHFKEKVTAPELCHGLYEATVEKIYDIVFETHNDIDNLMIVGHNPGFTYFANEFANNHIDWLPTSGLICIDFDTDKWEQITMAKSSLRFYVTPKTLRDNGKIKTKMYD